MMNNQSYQKNGVFTSWNKTNEGVTQQNNVRKEVAVISQYTNPTQQPIIITKTNHIQSVPRQAPNLGVEELVGAKFTNSIGYSNERPEIHIGYGQSNFVPPPPQRFLVNSGQSYSQPSQLPINSGPMHVQSGMVINPVGQQTVHTVQPLFQNVTRTYIPHHIYNEIPVVNSETKRYEDGNQAEGDLDEEALNEVDERMLEQYEKLYANFLEERNKNQHLERQLRQYQMRMNERETGTTINNQKTVIQTRQVAVDRPKKIDVKLLASLISKRNQAVIDQLVERKKNACLNKLRALLAQEESAMKTVIIRSSEEFSSSKVRIK